MFEYIFAEVETLFGVYDFNFSQIRASSVLIVAIDLVARLDMAEHIVHNFFGF